jgi:hypothetical protein
MIWDRDTDHDCWGQPWIVDSPTDGALDLLRLKLGQSAQGTQTGHEAVFASAVTDCAGAIAVAVMGSKTSRLGEIVAGWWATHHARGVPLGH